MPGFLAEFTLSEANGLRMTAAKLAIFFDNAPLTGRVSISLVELPQAFHH
jgi:hypothetical protein